MFLPSLLVALILLLSAALAAPNANLPRDEQDTVYMHRKSFPQPRQSSVDPTDPSCRNAPGSRQCWGEGYSILTNVEASWPKTGKTVAYDLTISEGLIAPDGFERAVQLVNGKYPGPTLHANWGDTMQIRLTNNLPTNGTSIHWHGIRQWQSNTMDGTNGITECPLAPSQSKVYTFLCTEFGTSWYHSHHASQYTDGVLGTIVIDGPSTANYDIDLGTLTISDWYHTPASIIFDQLYRSILISNPRADSVLINGTQRDEGAGGGHYFNTTLESGKRYKLRLVNTATSDSFQVGLDSHNFTVIAADFVPVQPYETDWLFMAIGQRYDIIIDADQPSSSHWFHAVPQNGCSTNALSEGTAIFNYADSNTTIPSAPSTNAPPTSTCADAPSLVPFVPINVPAPPTSSPLDIAFTIPTANNNSTPYWSINLKPIQTDWSNPTLSCLINDTTPPPFLNTIPLSPLNTWTYQLIRSPPTPASPQMHPIHLHGHNFYILGSASDASSFDPATTPLQLNNPMRRDVAALPENSWLFIAFLADNPGAWLLHCHVAWHVGLGLGVQFLEGDPKEVQGMAKGWDGNCESWKAFAAQGGTVQEGSGL